MIPLMRKLAGLFLLLATFAGAVLAQDTQTPPPDQSTAPVKPKHTYPTPKGEISAGFAYRSYYGLTAKSIGMIGAYGSYTYNFYRWLGLEGELLGVTGTLKVPAQPSESVHVFTMLAGPKIYPLGHHKLDPFGHFLYGEGVSVTDVPEFADFGQNTIVNHVQSWQAGGGLDLSLKRHWAVRLVQLDYASSKFLGKTVPNQGSKRVSFGIIYRFGER